MAVGEVVALVFGNERRGVSPGLLEAADASFYLPMAGFTQSFNISVPARHLTAAHRHLTVASPLPPPPPSSSAHTCYQPNPSPSPSAMARARARALARWPWP